MATNKYLGLVHVLNSPAICQHGEKLILNPVYTL